MAGSNKIPGRWQEFLQDSDNKQELFAFLSAKVALTSFPNGKTVVITSEERVIVQGNDFDMPKTNHEEADTKMVLHLLDALQRGSKTCLIRTVDTDVVVILIGMFEQLTAICQMANIWVAFGTGKNFTYYHVNDIATTLGTEKSVSLPVFHSFTGCDTVSAFYGKAKASAWTAWKCFPEVTEAFYYIAKHPFIDLDKDSRLFELLERFTVVLYDKTSQLCFVNEARQKLFCQKDKVSMEALPPTRAVLFEHCKRAMYQAGIWTTADKPIQQAPSPGEMGWTFDKERQVWLPYWSELDEVSKACSHLVKCQCLKACGNACSCGKRGWKCSKRCGCKCRK